MRYAIYNNDTKKFVTLQTYDTEADIGDMFGELREAIVVPIDVDSGVTYALVCRSAKDPVEVFPDYESQTDAEDDGRSFQAKGQCTEYFTCKEDNTEIEIKTRGW